AEVATVPDAAYRVTDLTCGTFYRLGVRAVDSAGNLSALQTVGKSTLACPVPADAPAAPGSSGLPVTNVSISGKEYPVSSPLSDVIFDVAGSTPSGVAVKVLPGGSLTRVVVNTHGLVAVGISGGKVKDCRVTEATYAA